jgi:hypothetical protein
LLGFTVSLSIQKSTAKNCVNADSEISRQTVSLPIQKSTTNAAKNFVATNLEIGSQLLCRCRFRNQQPKTSSLLIQKSATKNFADANLEISSRTVSLPIQKSATKNCITVDSKINSDGGVISDLFGLYLLFFCVYIILWALFYFVTT